MSFTVNIANAGLTSAGGINRAVPGYGDSLSASDIKLIRAATGVNFNWPPAAGDRIVLAADQIAAAKTRASLAGHPWGNLTPAKLQELHRMGVISQDFLDKAMDYLHNGTISKDPDSTGPAASSSPGAAVPPSSDTSGNRPSTAPLDVYA